MPLHPAPSGIVSDGSGRDSLGERRGRRCLEAVQVTGIHLGRIAEEHGGQDKVLQLADVPGPG